MDKYKETITKIYKYALELHSAHITSKYVSEVRPTYKVMNSLKQECEQRLDAIIGLLEELGFTVCVDDNCKACCSIRIKFINISTKED